MGPDAVRTGEARAENSGVFMGFRGGSIRVSTSHAGKVIREATRVAVPVESAGSLASVSRPQASEAIANRVTVPTAVGGRCMAIIGTTRAGSRHRQDVERNGMFIFKECLLDRKKKSVTANEREWTRMLDDVHQRQTHPAVA